MYIYKNMSEIQTCRYILLNCHFTSIRQLLGIIWRRLVHIIKSQNMLSVIGLINLQLNTFCLIKWKCIQIIAHNSRVRIENIQRISISIVAILQIDIAVIGNILFTRLFYQTDTMFMLRSKFLSKNYIHIATRYPYVLQISRMIGILVFIFRSQIFYSFSQKRINLFRLDTYIITIIIIK